MTFNAANQMHVFIDLLAPCILTAILLQHLATRVSATCRFAPYVASMLLSLASRVLWLAPTLACLGNSGAARCGFLIVRGEGAAGATGDGGGGGARGSEGGGAGGWWWRHAGDGGAGGGPLVAVPALGGGLVTAMTGLAVTLQVPTPPLHWPRSNAPAPRKWE